MFVHSLLSPFSFLSSSAVDFVWRSRQTEHRIDTSTQQKIQDLKKSRKKIQIRGTKKATMHITKIARLRAWICWWNLKIYSLDCSGFRCGVRFRVASRCMYHYIQRCTKVNTKQRFSNTAKKTMLGGTEESMHLCRAQNVCGDFGQLQFRRAWWKVEHLGMFTKEQPTVLFV